MGAGNGDSAKKEPRRFDQTVFYFENCHAFNGFIAQAVDLFVVEHFVAQCGAGNDFCSQGWVVEAVLFIEGIKGIAPFQGRCSGWRAVSDEVFAKAGGESLEIVGVVRLILADDGFCD